MKPHAFCIMVVMLHFSSMLYATLIANSYLMSVADADPTTGQQNAFDHQLKFYDKLWMVSEAVERTPRLKQQVNERASRSRGLQLPPLDFTCDTSIGRSPTRPTSVHQLRPGDIDIISAFGDSISAGNGLGAPNLPAVAIENRGEVWSIGGDGSIEDGVITLPNIMRKFNPNLKGMSVCRSTRDNIGKSNLNVAEPGGDNSDMPPQANMLVQRLRDDPNVNIEQDWKFVTLFVGGNDLCGVCGNNKHSIENYYRNFDLAVQILHDNLPRTIVNLVSMFDVTPLKNFSTGLACEYLQWHFCDCARNATTLPTMRTIQLAYHQQLETIANDPKFKDKEDFTVVVQPHLLDMVPPIDPETGGFLEGFLSPDCFHPNRIAHQAFGAWMWNTILTRIGEKPHSYDSSDFDIKVICPTEENPYIFTDQNSGRKAANDAQDIRGQRSPSAGSSKADGLNPGSHSYDERRYRQRRHVDRPRPGRRSEQKP